MAKREEWMLPEHSWPGITHDHFDLIPALALVAMHWTIGASRLSGAKPATFQSHGRVLQQAMAFAAK